MVGLRLVENFWGLSMLCRYNNPEVDRIWGTSGISWGSLKGHILSTPKWLYPPGLRGSVDENQGDGGQLLGEMLPGGGRSELHLG